MCGGPTSSSRLGPVRGIVTRNTCSAARRTCWIFCRREAYRPDLRSQIFLSMSLDATCQPCLGSACQHRRRQPSLPIIARKNCWIRPAEFLRRTWEAKTSRRPSRRLRCDEKHLMFEHTPIRCVKVCFNRGSPVLSQAVCWRCSRADSLVSDDDVSIVNNAIGRTCIRILVQWLSRQKRE